MILHVCMQCMHCTYVSVSSTWSSMKWTDGRGIYYGTVRYSTVLPLGGERDACMYACVHVCWAGRCCAVLGWAVRCWAGRCGAVLASLSESNEKKKMKVKDKKRK